jgi:hypothetical protein
MGYRRGEEEEENGRVGRIGREVEPGGQDRGRRMGSVVGNVVNDG